MTTMLERELREQPEVAARLLAATEPRLPELRAALGVPGTEQVLLVARGSSDNAAQYARYLWEVALGLPVSLAAPSLTTVYGRPLQLRRHAVVAVSQSGRSPDVVGVVEQARAAGCPTLAVTNDPASPLADAAAHTLDLAAGPERSVAATKTYTGSLLALALLSLALAEDGGRPEQLADLARVPGALHAAVDGLTGLAAAADVLAAADRAVCVGRGLNLSTAHEISLKLTELTGTLVAPYSPADLMHGPVAAVGPDVPVVVVAPEEEGTASVLDIVPELRRRGAPVLTIGAREVPGTHLLGLPEAAALPGWLSPLTCVVAGQLLAWRVAERRGIDVDRPGELSKITLTH
ncbi:MAG: SIS domain-containing protein [Nocardioidaceae bacterium]